MYKERGTHTYTNKSRHSKNNITAKTAYVFIYRFSPSTFHYINHSSSEKLKGEETIKKKKKKKKKSRDGRDSEVPVSYFKVLRPTKSPLSPNSTRRHHHHQSLLSLSKCVFPGVVISTKHIRTNTTTQIHRYTDTLKHTHTHTQTEQMY